MLSGANTGSATGEGKKRKNPLIPKELRVLATLCASFAKSGGHGSRTRNCFQRLISNQLPNHSVTLRIVLYTIFAQRPVQSKGV